MKTQHLVLCTAVALGIAFAASSTAGAKQQRKHPAQFAPMPPTVDVSLLPTPGELLATTAAQRGASGGGAGTARVTALYAAMGNGSSVSPGSVALLDGATFIGTSLAQPTNGFNGVTFTLDGRMWASTGGIGAGFSRLHEIDKATGTSLGFVGLSKPGGDLTICDLATQPGTGTIYALEVGTGVLFTIDPLTGVGTPLGSNGIQNYGGIAFAPDGTLYLISSTVANPILLTLDTATGAATSTITYGPDVGCCGLEVRPSDGVLLATRGAFAGGDAIVQVDPVTGATSIVGTTGVGTPSDIAFDAGFCQLDLGFGGPGQTTLEICGEDLLTQGNSATLVIDSSLVSTPAILAVAPGFNPIPFFGGTLVPTGLPFVVTNFITDGNGDVILPVMASGATPQVLYLQAGVIDLSLPGLVQLSNAVQLTIVL